MESMEIMCLRWQIISDSSSSLFHDMLKPLIVIAILVILILLSSEALVGLFSFTRLINTRGNLQHPPNIAIYQDSTCTTPLFNIHWGSLEPGMARKTTIYIRNEGDEEVELYLEAASWEPTNISSYLNLTWNYNGAAVLPIETVEVTLTLSSSSSPDFTEYLVAYDVREFSFDIIITAFS